MQVETLAGAVVPNLRALIQAAKNEQAQSARNALLAARIRIMAYEVFPAHKPFDIEMGVPSWTR